MTDKDIVKQLINGASLRTFMVPDEAIPSNYPEHIETFDLPHLIIKGEAFWGKSESVHAGYKLGEKIYPPCSFCYTNITDLFCSYTPSTNACVFMDKKRYRKHNWLFKNNYRLVWDSEGDSSTGGIKRGIEDGEKFKIAMLDSEGIWNIHPVELPMYYSQEQYFALNSPGDQYPMFFRTPCEILELQEKHAAFFNKKAPGKTSGLKHSDIQAFYSFYVLKSDGSYHSTYDIARGTSQRYKRLKVFVERP